MKKYVLPLIILATFVSLSSSLFAQQTHQEKIAFANKAISYSERELELARSEFAREKATLVLKLRQLDLAVLQGENRSEDISETVNDYNRLMYNKMLSLKAQGFASTQEVLQSEFKLLHGVVPHFSIPLSFTYIR